MRHAWGVNACSSKPERQCGQGIVESPLPRLVSGNDLIQLGLKGAALGQIGWQEYGMNNCMNAFRIEQSCS